MAHDTPYKYQDGSGILFNIQGVSSGERKNIQVDSSGYLLSKPEGYSTVGHGSQTVANGGTPLQLGSDTACKLVVVCANEGNTDIIVVGGDNTVDATQASRTGQVLFPGQTGTFPVSNLNKLWLDVEIDGEGVSYIYYT